MATDMLIVKSAVLQPGMSNTRIGFGDGGPNLNEYYQSVFEAVQAGITAGDIVLSTAPSGALTVTTLTATAVSSTTVTPVTLAFAGATGANNITIPDNLANALTVKEGSNAFVTFVTTNSGEKISFLKRITAVLPTYVDNAAALTGGLVATDLYKTATGEVRIVV